MPLRVLAFEVNETGKAAVITNSYDYLANRHSLPDDQDIRARYEAAIAQAMTGIPKDAIALFASDVMTDSGLVTLTSMHDFATTVRRILDAINARSDTVSFGKIDFTDRSKEHGIDLEPIISSFFWGARSWWKGDGVRTDVRAGCLLSKTCDVARRKWNRAREL